VQHLSACPPLVVSLGPNTHAKIHIDTDTDTLKMAIRGMGVWADGRMGG